jgi:hypothetical protein
MRHYSTVTTFYETCTAANSLDHANILAKEVRRNHSDSPSASNENNHRRRDWNTGAAITVTFAADKWQSRSCLYYEFPNAKQE